MSQWDEQRAVSELIAESSPQAPMPAEVWGRLSAVLAALGSGDELKLPSGRSGELLPDVASPELDACSPDLDSPATSPASPSE